MQPSFNLNYLSFMFMDLAGPYTTLTVCDTERGTPVYKCVYWCFSNNLINFGNRVQRSTFISQCPGRGGGGLNFAICTVLLLQCITCLFFLKIRFGGHFLNQFFPRYLMVLFKLWYFFLLNGSQNKFILSFGRMKWPKWVPSGHCQKVLYLLSQN